MLTVAGNVKAPALHLPSLAGEVNVCMMTDATLPQILVVDDNEDNAHIIRDYLESKGYPISVAYNGDEA
ncbi:MAG: hypothetical protein ABIQ55_10815, partial [Gemmatimonadaceae bacterium]